MVSLMKSLECVPSDCNHENALAAFFRGSRRREVRTRGHPDCRNNVLCFRQCQCHDFHWIRRPSCAGCHGCLSHLRTRVLTTLLRIVHASVWLLPAPHWVQTCRLHLLCECCDVLWLHLLYGFSAVPCCSRTVRGDLPGRDLPLPHHICRVPQGTRKTTSATSFWVLGNHGRVGVGACTLPPAWTPSETRQWTSSDSGRCKAMVGDGIELAQRTRPLKLTTRRIESTSHPSGGDPAS